MLGFGDSSAELFIRILVSCIKEAFSEVIGEMLTPYLDKLSENAEKTAHYSQRTADNTKDDLTMDDYKVNKQLERVKADSGYSFTPALV